MYILSRDRNSSFRLDPPQRVYPFRGQAIHDSPPVTRTPGYPTHCRGPRRQDERRSVPHLEGVLLKPLR
jgi:hypothetical protein